MGVFRLYAGIAPPLGLFTPRSIDKNIHRTDLLGMATDTVNVVQ